MKTKIFTLILTTGIFSLFLLQSCSPPEYTGHWRPMIGDVIIDGKTAPNVLGGDIGFICTGQGTSCELGSTHTIHIDFLRAGFIDFKQNYYDSGAAKVQKYFKADSVSTWQTLFPSGTVPTSARTMAASGTMGVYVAKDSSIVFYHDSALVSNISFVYIWNK